MWLGGQAGISNNGADGELEGVVEIAPLQYSPLALSGKVLS